MTHTISDLTVKSTVLDDDAFTAILNNDGPAGFNPFQTFYAGDYEYEEAIFRLSMNSTSGDRGVIEKLSVTVDVPDVFDRGDQIISLAGEPTRVLFARSFHIPPVVVLQVQSASDPCKAKLVDGSVTRTYFDCYLERDSDLEKITGALTWVAHAY